MFFSRWCRRYAALLTAVGAAFYSTARVNAARFSGGVVGDILPFTAVGAAFYTTARVNAPRFSTVGVAVMLPIFPLLVPPFALRLGRCCPLLFNRWCKRYAAHFTAVGAVFYTTARVNAPRFLVVCLGVMLPIFPMLVAPFALRLG